MERADQPDVLVVGAGPVGLTAAGELRRRGVSCRIADRLTEPQPYAKAIGIQPRTLEIWDRAGLVREILDAAVPLRGQLTYVDGTERDRTELVLPPEVPYGFAALPQYETERVLETRLARLGTRVERGTELGSFTQDARGVTSRLTGPAGEEEVRSRYLVGCDGAHSTVRKTLGLSFEGGAFPATYMLADVVLDWDLPPGYAVRATRRGTDGTGDAPDVLVCVPLPGPGRYRVSMAAPPELARERRPEGADGVAHGLGGGGLPGLDDIQRVLDRLSPRPVTASAARWSSVFRISHRIVDRYGAGRVLVAGDAAHIHPPTGAQGMNTGIQDAVNLAWKLAVALDGAAPPGLVASYDAERRPVGEEVVGRTVRHAAGGVTADPGDPGTVLLREAQLLISYRDGPLAGPPDPAGDGPQPGDRAPDCAGLVRDIAGYPLRLYDVLRERDQVLVLYGIPEGTDVDALTGTGEAAEGAFGAPLHRCLILAEDDPAPVTRLPVLRDARGEFARQYGASKPTAFLIRPDGYLAARISPPTARDLREGLARLLGG
ncbi:FAD-dependent monooxygenase [Streptomyces sp. NPDC020875]|uniref:FAD-dependent monooxygenase n=1 Tax=Streptomyces sp. NPDC020875 TaxID=3154898 RepID=UPI0033C1769E